MSPKTRTLPSGLTATEGQTRKQPTGKSRDQLAESTGNSKESAEQVKSVITGKPQALRAVENKRDEAGIRGKKGRKPAGTSEQTRSEN